MEKNLVGECIREIIKVNTRFYVNSESEVKLQQPQNKSLIVLKNEEQILKTQLENIKKENFSLEASVRAWRTTYQEKQKELAEAESKLNDIYNQIWSEREDFCVRADKFDTQYGVLSKWWEKRMDKIFNPHQDTSDEKYKGSLEKIEMNIDDVQVQASEKKDTSPEIFDAEPGEENLVLNSEEILKESSLEADKRSETSSKIHENEITEQFSTSCNESETTEFTEKTAEEVQYPKTQTNEETSEFISSEINKEKQKKKKVRFSMEEDKMTFSNENSGTLKIDFFSIVDAETVRKANRFKNRRKNQLFGQTTKSQ